MTLHAMSRSLPLAVLASAGTGGLIDLLWAPLGLPPHGGPHDAPFPGLWRWFFAIWLPALFPAFTALHLLLLRASPAGEPSAAIARAAGRWDRWSYAFLPAFLLLMVAAGQVGRWRLPFAAFFIGVLFAKVLLAVVTLYRGVVLPDRAEGAADPPGLGLHLFLVALGLYGFLIPYVVTALSTAGDEHIYLLNTHSLYADGDLDIRNNVAQRDWERFYWGRPAPATWTQQFIGLPTLLLPGYALATAILPDYPLAGRLGATLTLALFAALLAWHVYGLCRDLGASRPAAFWAWVVVALTPPVLVNSSHIYPEIPAAFAAVAGVRALLRVPERVWPALLLVAGAAAFVVVLKDRYTPLALGLLLWALARLAPRRVLLALPVLAGLVAAALYLILFNPLPHLFPNLGSLAHLRDTLLVWNRHIPRAALGLWADQEFGLLSYGPHWTLAVVGAPLLWRRTRWAALGLLGLLLFYVVVVVQYRWIQWDAGWTPPPRFLLAAAPLLAPFIAEVFQQGRGRALAAVNTLWLLWSGAVGFWLSLVPFWRYNDLDGRSTLLQLAGTQLGLDLARFLPSLQAPTGWTWAALALGGLLLLAATVAAARRRSAPTGGWGRGAVLLGPWPASGLAAMLVAIWLAAASLVPTWSLEAEAMRHSGGIRYGSYQNERILWVMTRDGEVSEPIVTWPGLSEVTVFAGGYTSTSVPPRMRLLLGSEPVEEWTLEAGQGRWVQRAYVARVQTRFGHPRLQLQFVDLLDDRGAGRVQHAYIDRLRLRRIDAR